MTKKKKTSSVSKLTKKGLKASKQEVSNKANPCISTNSDPNSPKPSNSEGTRTFKDTQAGNQTTFSNLKNHTKYDDDFRHSKKLHLATCKAHQETVFRSIEKRNFYSADLDDFKALMGKDGFFADHMPASDLRLRHKLGNLLIDEFGILLHQVQAHPTLQLYLVTYVADKFMYNECDGEAEVHRFTQAVQASIRSYTSFSAIGVIENQAIVNYPKDQKGKMHSLHAHVICWGTSNDAAELKRRAKGFKSSITKLPIHSQKVTVIEGSLGRLARYITKPPYEGKEVNFEKLEAGKACLYSARRMEKYHHLRLFEYQSKLPIVNTIFAVRDGAEIRSRIVAELKHWQRNRKGSEIKLEDRIYPLFEAFLRDNKRLKNYKPMMVNYRKNSGSSS